MQTEDLANLPIIAQAPTWTLYRDAMSVMLVRFHGDIDDAASDGWRSAAKASFDRDGWTRVAFVEPSDGTATSTLGSRMRTASFLRLTARNVERVVIVSSRTTNFVIKTMMRAAGVANVELIDADRALAELGKIRARN